MSHWVSPYFALLLEFGRFVGAFTSVVMMMMIMMFIMMFRLKLLPDGSERLVGDPLPVPPCLPVFGRSFAGCLPHLCRGNRLPDRDSGAKAEHRQSDCEPPNDVSHLRPHHLWVRGQKPLRLSVRKGSGMEPLPPPWLISGSASGNRQRLDPLRAGPTPRSGVVPVRPVLVAGVRYFGRYRTGRLRDGVLLSVA